MITKAYILIWEREPKKQKEQKNRTKNVPLLPQHGLKGRALQLFEVVPFPQQIVHEAPGIPFDQSWSNHGPKWRQPFTGKFLVPLSPYQKRSTSPNATPMPPIGSNNFQTLLLDLWEHSLLLIMVEKIFKSWPCTWAPAGSDPFHFCRQMEVDGINNDGAKSKCLGTAKPLAKSSNFSPRHMALRRSCWVNAADSPPRYEHPSARRPTPTTGAPSRFWTLVSSKTESAVETSWANMLGSPMQTQGFKDYNWCLEHASWNC